LLFKKGEILYGKGKKVKVKSTIGCGDAFVAGFLFSFKRNKNLNECLRYAIACGTGKVKKEGTKMPERKEIIKILNNTSVFPVNYEWICKNLPL